MLSRAELQAFAGKINLVLLNDIMSFVLSTSEGNGELKQAIMRDCIFWDGQANASAFQEKYRFLYLGELLERYDERFGSSLTDLRAIALALGYTCGLTTDSMFIGQQRTDFLRRVKRQADKDPYLTGAQYLLSGGQSNASDLEDRLLKAYASTEELLFVVSLLPRTGQTFSRMSVQLLHYLSAGRTMPVLGNMKAMMWLIEWLLCCGKGAKGKETALFRALTALPGSFIKKGSKHYTVLLECGFSPLEIAYANIMSALSQTTENALQRDSVVIYKIVIELFKEVLAVKEPLAPVVYSRLAEIFYAFQHFKTRCYGFKHLSDALKCEPKVKDAETWMWLAGLLGIEHPVLGGFDVMDSNWDVIAQKMDRDAYRTLFERGLYADMERSDIQARIDRYDSLTGERYLDGYQTGSRYGEFELLAEKGIVDLWELFQNCLDSDGQVVETDLTYHISRTLRGITHRQAFLFYQRLIEAYGISGMSRLPRYYLSDFAGSLINQNRYSSSDTKMSLTISREFLDSGEQAQMLRWAEEYEFIFYPEAYPSFVIYVLLDETAAGLIPKEDRRVLFEQVIGSGEVSGYLLSALKKVYFTEEELRAEKEAAEIARQEKERQELLATQEAIQKEYANGVDGTDGAFRFTRNFLSGYRYFGRECEIAFTTVYESLCEMKQGPEKIIDRQEAIYLLEICGMMLDKNNMDYQEVQSWIAHTKVKEGDNNDHDECEN